MVMQDKRCLISVSYRLLSVLGVAAALAFVVRMSIVGSKGGHHEAEAAEKIVERRVDSLTPPPVLAEFDRRRETTTN